MLDAKIFRIRYLVPGPALREGKAPHFGGLPSSPLLLTIHITNTQLNYLFFNQYLNFSTEKYALSPLNNKI